MTKEVFDATWLALREPADHRSRALALLPLLNVVWSRAHWSRVLDFGSGTGSNLRYLGPKLPDGQEWTLVDHDPDLLALATIPARVRGLKHVCGDVADEGLELVKEAHLVTGSALLDLVSEDWLRDLIEECRLAECGVLFALSYDGSITWDLGQGVDEDPGDVLVWNAVNKHQRRDKGLGPALGPRLAPWHRSCFGCGVSDLVSSQSVAPKPARFGTNERSGGRMAGAQHSSRIQARKTTSVHGPSVASDRWRRRDLA